MSAEGLTNVFLGLYLALHSTPGQTGPMPWTGLIPARPRPGLCVLHYAISTRSAACQAFFDQGLAWYYSYAWMEAARAFETATVLDPECAMAWWGLSRALERWGRGDHKKALERAWHLAPRTSYREQQLILARMQEQGLLPDAGDAQSRRQKAIQTIENLIGLHSDDEEAWYYRAQLAGGSSLFGGTASSAPYYLALLKINPLHPGANHELVHYYENVQRPALGWVYSENYIRSSPGIPHAWHMQSHLATRLGRWDRSTASSLKAIELQQAYHREMQVKPQDDWQYGHHLEILTLSLIHDGRFREARQAQAEARRAGFDHRMAWFRLHLAERDWAQALQIAESYRTSDKQTASYLAALVYLAREQPAWAAAEVEVLRQEYAERRDQSELKYRLWETQGVLLCQVGEAEAGLELLQRLVLETRDDYRRHAWGHGAYFMEIWGIAALKSGHERVAEEAFLEALAHDAGSVRAALGLHILCDRLGRNQEAEQYARLARRFWKYAEPRHLDAEWTALRSPYREKRTARPASGGQTSAHTDHEEK
ncbi:MAG: hypothetical protein C4297_05690 [Gemmataceae bacterium]